MSISSVRPVIRRSLRERRICFEEWIQFNGNRGPKVRYNVSEGRYRLNQEKFQPYRPGGGSHINYVRITDRIMCRDAYNLHPIGV